MKKIFMRKIVLVITLVVIVAACTSRKGGSEVFPKDFFGVNFGDDSATVKKKWREVKMYQDGAGRQDWLLHFRKRPEGYVSFGGAVWECVDAIFDEDGRLSGFSTIRNGVEADGIVYRPGGYMQPLTVRLDGDTLHITGHVTKDIRVDSLTAKVRFL